MGSTFGHDDALAVQKLAHSDTPLGRRVLSALQIIDQAILRYGDALAISFNGGKDATVLLHLYLAGLHLSSSRDRAFASGSVDAAASSSSPQAGKNSISNGASTDSTAVTQATGVYVQCQSPFPQVEDFVEEATKKYQVELEVVNAPMKEALKIYKARRESSARPVEAVLVGTRVGDPFAEMLQTFTMTDGGWPQLMRVHPILDWTYDDIWLFLRSSGLDISWCKLYDYGYTSLGSTFNTIPNPRLRDASRSTGWKPAWELDDPSTERAGRPAGPIPKEVAQPLTKPHSRT